MKINRGEAIGLSTHQLKWIELGDLKVANRAGKVIKLRASVQVFPAYATAHRETLALVGGNCNIVGLVIGNL